MDTFFIFLLVLIITLEALAQYYLQKHVYLSKYRHLIFGTLLYGAIAYTYYHILKTGQNIIVVTTLWSMGSIIIGALVGFFLFNQKITQKMLLGIILAFIGSYLIL